MSSPHLTDQYPILSLPRVKEVSLSQKLAIPQLRQTDGSTLSSSSSSSSVIDFGVSNSMLASYITKPSPKLIWSYSIKPTVSITCIDVWQSSKARKLYVVGLAERKKSRILVVETDNASTEDGSFSITTVNEKELSLGKDSVVAVKFLSDTEIVVVYQSGSVHIVKNEIELSIATKFESEGNVIYSTFITDLEDALLLTVSQSTSALTYNLVSITASRILPIQSHQAKPLTAVFTYNSGILYQYHDGVVDSIAITNFHLQKTISVASILKTDELVSMTSPAPDRLLLGNANMIYLLNFKYEAILAEFKSVSSSSNPIPDKVYVNQVVPVKGSSQSTQTTRAYYINLKNKDNNVYLNVIDVNVGLNKLSECLGKSIEQSELTFSQVVDLYNNNKEEEEADTVADELDQVYQSLKQACDARDVNKWESILIPYLKTHKSWQEIKKSKPKTKTKTYQFKEFDVENDRIVDINFINSIFDLIFTTNPLQFRDTEFIPEYTLMYLLTSPIYSKEHTTNLVQLLNDTGNTTLLKQAIKTCSNIPLGDLLVQFVITEDVDIFIALIDRIVDDFATAEITSSLKTVISQYSTDIIALINKIISTSNNKGWVIIEILVDINGLFNWSQENVSRLNQIIDEKLANMDINAYNLTLVDQVQLKRNQLKKNKDVSANGVLTITDQTYLNKKVESDLNEEIPLYSIERLEI
ncbi:UTP8 [Candida theae]|uniref:UTP8 n=1 Tax=Candida theae TaxID=1198502 RepID=A0AAD5G153_9ASCO|nr:UTP8 [Candida theae]KAI5968431.1 UTP8 [Candida theae]